jgi:hypothetical protein
MFETEDGRTLFTDGSKGDGKAMLNCYADPTHFEYSISEARAERIASELERDYDMVAGRIVEVELAWKIK